MSDTFRCININFYDSLRFLADISKKLLKKTQFFDNLRTISQEGGMKTS